LKKIHRRNRKIKLIISIPRSNIEKIINKIKASRDSSDKSSQNIKVIIPKNKEIMMLTEIKMGK